MVDQIEDEVVITTTDCQIQTKPSLKRWLKHSFYFKSSKSIFSNAQKQQIADVIQIAEDGHRGEIQVIIEASFPSNLAFQIESKQRAEQLFAQYKVWDTEFNTGILIYLNLCEHQIEIVADRGIHQAVRQSCWDEICQSMLPYFKQQQFTTGLCIGIEQLGQLLKKFYGNDRADPQGNELDNLPKLL